MFRKKIFTALALCFLLNHVFAQREFVKQIISNVNIDSLVLSVRQLSGDTTFLLNGLKDSITSRYADSPDINKASQFIKQRFQLYGLNPLEQGYHTNGYNGKNIYAIQPSSQGSKKCYIICAHYDDLPVGKKNYGVDDNASGVSGVLEAARLLGKLSLPFTIYYILFDHEEQGLIGSDYFCTLFDIGLNQVSAVLNLDMISYDGNNDSVSNIHLRNNAGDILIANSINYINITYQIGLHINQITPPSFQSDHSSFWNNFMPAVFITEDDKNDMNPGYHTLNDRMNLVNKSFFHRMAKLAVGTLTDFTSDSTHLGVNTILPENSQITLAPNPIENNEIMIEGIIGNHLHYRITDAKGILVTENKITIEQAPVILKLPPEISSGLYFLEMITGEANYHKSFIK